MERLRDSKGRFIKIYTSKTLTKGNNMERLTKKVSVGYNPAPQKYGSRVIYNKLGKLEDIEQELGIDLITLFKVLETSSIYTKTKRYDNSNSLSYMGNSWLIMNMTYKKCFHFKDYGKTWALTKEELE